MRILMVTDAYPPQIGGANRSTQMLAQEMTARGHEVVVASSWQQGLATVGDDGQVRVHRLRDSTSRLPWISADPYLHIPPPFPDPEAVWRFRRLIGRFRPDVVHAYGWLTYPCAAALLGTGVPLVVSARDYGNVCAVRTLIRNGEEICDGPGLRKCLVCASRFYGPVKGTVAVAGVLGGRPLLRRRTRVVHSISGYVYRCAILHHLDLGRAGRELYRVLRPGGVAVFCEPWGGNPLLEFARRRLPYPGKERTPDERPLCDRDLPSLRAVFPSLRVQGFQLLGMVRRVVPRLAGPLDRGDSWLLRAAPGLGRFCRYAVLTMRR